MAPAATSAYTARNSAANVSAKPSTWPPGSAAAAWPAASSARRRGFMSSLGRSAMAQPQRDRAAPNPTPRPRSSRRSRTRSVFLRPALICEMPMHPPRTVRRSAAGSSRVLGLDSTAERCPWRARCENVSTGPAGCVPDRDEGRQVGHHLCHPAAGDEAGQVQPVRADVADRPQRAALLALEAPVPVGIEQQPVLEVAPADQPHVAQPAVTRSNPREVLVERVEADVEVDRALTQRRAVGREATSSADSRRRHRQRLLAHDVPAGGEDLPDLRVVQLVGRGDVDDLDALVGQQLLEAAVCARRYRSGPRAALPRSGDEPSSPRTSTPIRRRASMWTVPMKPLPMTAAPMGDPLMRPSRDW